jgi:hypothetical protein
LSAAEHADHLAAQLQPVVGQHGIQACVPTPPVSRLIGSTRSLHCWAWRWLRRAV